MVFLIMWSTETWFSHILLFSIPEPYLLGEIKFENVLIYIYNVITIVIIILFNITVSTSAVVGTRHSSFVDLFIAL